MPRRLSRGAARDFRARPTVLALIAVSSWWLASAECGAAQQPAALSGQSSPTARESVGLQPDYVGRPIVRVEVLENGQRIEDDAVIDLIETSVGQPLDMADVRETILHLFSLGRFANVEADVRLEETGVAVLYRAVPLTRSTIEFTGDPGLPIADLRQAVRARFGQSAPAAAIGDITDVLERVYRDRGYLQARVQPLSLAATEGRLVFDVQAGPPARLGRVDVRGVSPAAGAELSDDLGLDSGDVYDPVALAARIDEREEEFRQNGYYEAAIQYTPRLDARGTVDLLIDVDVGPHVTVTFEGDALTRQEREDLVPIGREGSVHEDVLEDTSRRIATYLRDQGYWRAAVEYRRTQTGNEQRVVFTVRKGRRYDVGRVEISGNVSVPIGDLAPRLRVQEGEPFREAALQADVVTIADVYRRRGFADVQVDTDVAELPPSAGEGAQGGATGALSVRIVVTEGARTKIASVAIAGADAISDQALREQIRVVPGDPYYRPDLLAARDILLLHYLNQGFQSAAIRVDATFSPDRTRADVTFSIDEGRQVVIDHIIIVGNERTSAATIERELVVAPGKPLGLADVIESQRRLRALGLFRRVQIDELRHRDRAARDLLITVEEAPSTSLGYGGGVEAGKRLRRSAEAGGQAEERLEFAPRGFFEIGRRNLWGKNRSVDLFTRISLRPRDDMADAARDGRGYGFSEYRVLGTYREPRLFGRPADAQVTGGLEQGIRSSFNFSRRSLDAQILRRLNPTLTWTGRYTFQRTRIFDERFNPGERLLVDRLFPQVRLSTLSLAVVRDTRSDPLEPRAGSLVGIDAETAPVSLGSQVGFAKTLIQAFHFREIASTGIVLALGARLGLANGFPREVPVLDEGGNPVLDENGDPVTDRVDDLPASERFFAGGDTTVRGFALDRLGDEATIDQDGFPRGGNALLILNSELRVPVWRDVGIVTFLDVGNVFAKADDVSLGRLRGGAGFGVRYRSPIGPIRFDLGFKLDRRALIPGSPERLTALHISIGHAF